jgi:hypothetical protein
VKSSINASACAFILCVLASCAAAAVTQWRTEDGGNGHYYEPVLSQTRVTWEDARALAESRGGYLATLTSAAEDAFVFSIVSSNLEYWSSNNYGGPWLGGYQPDPSVPASVGWEWVTGETWEYTNWALGEPGDQGGPGGRESYLHFVNFSGEWNDFANNGNSTFSYIIEWNMIPSPSPVGLLIAAGLVMSRRRR